MESQFSRKRVIVGLVVFLLVSVVGSFCLWKKNRPFNVPTGSMDPTIPPGTLVFVDEWAYRNPEDVKRGEVITFDTPARVYENQPGKENARSVYVFRVMGLPGDDLKISALGEVFLNGQPLKNRLEGGRYEEFQQSWYEIHPMEQATPMHKDQEVTLSESQFFVMGDNRPNAFDSRFWGLVPFDLIRGKVRLERISWMRPTD